MIAIEGLGDFYFERSNGERVLLGSNISEQEAMKIMTKFLEDHNFKSYYTRIWRVDNEVYYDVGSHSERFIFTIQN